MSDCQICADNAAADRGDDRWTVARVETGYIRLNQNQYFAGACFFLAKPCVRELHDLDPAARSLHLHEMAEVAAAMFAAFEPRKMNHEALGNGVPHLHWWLTPRYASDPRPFAPIWEDLEFLCAQWTDGGRPSDGVHAVRRSRLLSALRDRDLNIDREYV
jgi:diadenosine tetraphosphate (Ap4A) HIT family hydrolase